MIDGVSIGAVLSAKEANLIIDTLLLTCPASRETGEFRPTFQNHLYQSFDHKGRWGSYRVRVKEVVRMGRLVSPDYYLGVSGSVHKNLKGNNYSWLTASEVTEEITRVSSKLGIESSRFRLFSFEAGLNLPIEFPAFDFLEKHLLLYKTSTFSPYQSRAAPSIGFYSKSDRHTTKLYDKALQSGLPDPLLRYEVRHSDMHLLKKAGIRTLSDLTNRDKLMHIGAYLSKTWDNVLLWEEIPAGMYATLATHWEELLRNCRSPQFWTDLRTADYSKFNYQRSKYRKLVHSLETGVHKKMGIQIKQTWQKALNS
jgi:hypothetical protein